MIDYITLRTEIRSGDAEAVVRLHQVIYTRECGFDDTFLEHISEPLRLLTASESPRNRLWMAEKASELVGCIAVVEHSPTVARLRWFLVDPTVRGQGLGRRLLQEALAFCFSCEYDSVILWTVSDLTAAAHLYLSVGFRKIEVQPGRMGGVDVVEEKYEYSFDKSGATS